MMGNGKSHRKKFEELCAGYVLHLLDEDERKEFEQMLSTASEKEYLLYRKFESTAHRVTWSAEESESPDDLKKHLIAEVHSKPNATSLKKATSIEKKSTGEETDNGFDRSAFATAAAFALLIISLSLIFYSFNLSSEINQKESIIDDQETQINELQNELERKEELFSILEAQEVDLVMMTGLEVNPDGYGKVIWDSESQEGLLQVSNLPPVPNNKSYQLWIIKNNKHVGAGVFRVNDKNSSFFEIEEMVDAGEQAVSAFAVTMEPKGGSLQPSGEYILYGNASKEE